MTDNKEMRVRRNEEAVWRVIDGDVVVLHPEERMLHALKGCGSMMWELIEKETAISEILEVVCEEYEVEPARAEAEITQFVHNLKDLNLVEIVPVKSKEATL
jgi:hypothetical protein